MTSFRAEPVSRHLSTAQQAMCLNCRRAFVPKSRIVTFYVEGEVVGFGCVACVSAEARELLASKRA